MSTLAARRKARRRVYVEIDLIDEESDFDKYSVRVHPAESQIIEFAPSDTIPLKQLLDVVPKGRILCGLWIRAPSKRMPADYKPREITHLILCALNCPDRFTRKVSVLTLDCEQLPRTLGPDLIELLVHANRLQYWPVQLVPLLHPLKWFDCLCDNVHVDGQKLAQFYRLDQLVKHGLASSSSSSPQTPWTLFLTRGLYDPRLLLQITAFVF